MHHDFIVLSGRLKATAPITPVGLQALATGLTKIVRYYPVLARFHAAGAPLPYEPAIFGGCHSRPASFSASWRLNSRRVPQGGSMLDSLAQAQSTGPSGEELKVSSEVGTETGATFVSMSPANVALAIAPSLRAVVSRSLRA